MIVSEVEHRTISVGDIKDTSIESIVNKVRSMNQHSDHTLVTSLVPAKNSTIKQVFSLEYTLRIQSRIPEKKICRSDEGITTLTERIQDGYIKYKVNWIRSGPISEKELIDLTTWRDILYKLKLIGAYSDGIGFGNISERVGDTEQFLITGSATGSLPQLTGEHYTKVTEFDLTKNTLTCEGPIIASSESMTHGTIYRSDPSINGIIHVHNLDLWERLMNKVPTSSEDAKYGTPEMAEEVQRLFKETDVRDAKILVMAGHEEGIISFGRNLEEAGKIILRYSGNN